MQKKINIKYIPNILSNEGRIDKNITYSKKTTIYAYLKKAKMPDDLDNCHIIISGKREIDLSKTINAIDQIIVMPVIKHPIAFAKAMWTAAASFYTAYQFYFQAAFFLASIYFATRKPKLPTPGARESESPTYNWDGITSTQEVGIPVPIVYGLHRTGGNIITAYITTDGDKNYLNVLLAVSEGEIDSISGVEINDNPIANFDGVSTYTRMGTNTQAVLANFNDIHDVRSVGSELTKDNAVTYTTSSHVVEGFKIHFNFPSGLYVIDSGSGDIRAWEVTYKVEYRVRNTGAYIDLGSTTINAKSRSNVRRYYEKTGLTANQYDIKVTRTSADTSTYNIGDFWLQSVDETATDDIAYVNTALYGLKALASDQLSGGMPNFTCLVKGRKVNAPQIIYNGSQVDYDDYYWDPDVSKYKLFSNDRIISWDETTYIDQYNANPIWCVKDLLTNTRYGLGDYITAADHIDNSLFVEMSKYCDERVPDGDGGYEKRFRMDIVIDTASKALDWIMQLCATFRGMPFYSEGNIKIRIDKPEDPIQLFTMGNIAENSFTQSWKSIKQVPNVCNVSFVDKDKDYKKDTVAYTDEDSLAAGDPMRPMSVNVFAARLSQCLREARYALKVGKYVNRSISFTAGIDAIAIQPGDVFSVSHDVPQWGWSGRVKSAFGTQVTLDQEVTLSSGTTYALRIRNNINDYIEEKTVTTAASTTDVLTVSSAYKTLPKQFDVYAFGPTASVKKDFRCISLEREGLNKVKITATEYNALVYDDSEISNPTSNYSSLDLSIPSVASLLLTERLIKMADGSIELGIDVWFDPPTLTSYVKTARAYRIYISDDAGEHWSYKGEVANNFYTVVGNLQDLHEYKVAVTTITGFQEEGAVANSPQATITPVGKSAPPSDITSFLVNQTRDFLAFGWTKITDVDVWGYEIRKGDSWDSGLLVVAGHKSDKYSTRNFQTGASQSYWIKAVDTSGNYSENAIEAVVTIAVIPFQNIVHSYSEQTAWTGTKSDTEKSGDNLIISAGKLTGTYITPERDEGYVATFRLQIDSTTSITQSTAFDTSATAKFDDDATTRFTGSEAPGASTFEIRTSEDNITWTAWTDYQVGDYTCRYHQIRMTITRESVSTALLCSALNYYADLPDVVERGSDSVAVGDEAVGVTITYSKTFHETPQMIVELVGGNFAYYRTHFAVTTECTVYLYENDGTAKAGSFRWIAHGI